jgi:hypothetical protein
LQRSLLAPVDLNLALPPIDDPVFQHAATGVERALGLTVAAFVLGARREYLDDKIGSRMQLTIIGQDCRQAFLTHPYNIRRHIVVRREDQAGGLKCEAGVRPIVPLIQKSEQPPTRILVVVVRLLRHIQLSFDNFISFAIIWE